MIVGKCRINNKNTKQTGAGCLSLGENTKVIIHFPKYLRCLPIKNKNVYNTYSNVPLPLFSFIMSYLSTFRLFSSYFFCPPPEMNLVLINFACNL